MIEEGFVLMGAGMGVVGFFLTTMVVVMYGASAVLRRFDNQPKSGVESKNLTEIAVAVAVVKSRTSG